MTRNKPMDIRVNLGKNIFTECTREHAHGCLSQTAESELKQLFERMHTCAMRWMSEHIIYTIL